VAEPSWPGYYILSVSSRMAIFDSSGENALESISWSRSAPALSVVVSEGCSGDGRRVDEGIPERVGNVGESTVLCKIRC
jgi:hypothetical protein